MRRTKKEKYLLEAMAGTECIEFTCQFEDGKEETCYLIYNELYIGEAEAARCIDEKDFRNPYIAIMTKRQFENVFLIRRVPKKEQKKKLNDFEMYREFKKAKKEGLLDDTEETDEE